MCPPQTDPNYWPEAARDPDDLYGEQTVFLLEIRCRRNGSMSVAGNINDEAYALSVLDKAKQTVKDHHARQTLRAGSPYIIPPKDSGLLT